MAALIWGVAFVAQTKGLDYVGPFTLNGIRFLLGGFFLAFLLPLLDRLQKTEDPGVEEEKKGSLPELLLAGILCGVLLCIASNLQQVALKTVPAGKAGVLTALYIVIVPLLGIPAGKKCGKAVWISVGLAVIGLAFLCLSGGFRLQPGDGLLLLCALVFSLHILTIDYFSPRVDNVRMSMIQFFTCGIIGLFLMFTWEKPSLKDLFAAWLPILYTGILSSGVAYTLQIVGQKGMNPAIASLILSMEAVISVLAGFLLLGQHLTARELAGCVFMFAAILLAQLRS